MGHALRFQVASKAKPPNAHGRTCSLRGQCLPGRPGGRSHRGLPGAQVAKRAAGSPEVLQRPGATSPWGSYSFLGSKSSQVIWPHGGSYVCLGSRGPWRQTIASSHMATWSSGDPGSYGPLGWHRYRVRWTPGVTGVCLVGSRGSFRAIPRPLVLLSLGSWPVSGRSAVSRAGARPGGGCPGPTGTEPPRAQHSPAGLGRPRGSPGGAVQASHLEGAASRPGRGLGRPRGSRGELCRLLTWKGRPPGLGAARAKAEPRIHLFGARRAGSGRGRAMRAEVTCRGHQAPPGMGGRRCLCPLPGLLLALFYVPQLNT